MTSSESYSATLEKEHVQTAETPAVEVRVDAAGAYDCANAPMKTVDLNSCEYEHGRLGYRFVKALFDKLFSLIVVAICLIPGIILCIVIRAESKGSPIFKQERVGRYGRPIHILKFRTMYDDADTNPEKYFTPEQHAVWLCEYKVKDDPRITKVGKWLRETSLDELPQFLNVLFTRQLSVIGPRPVVRDELAAYGDKVKEFLSVKPGITGWWQVEARNDACYQDGKRQTIEIFYIENRSVSLDIEIFFMTFTAIFSKTGN